METRPLGPSGLDVSVFGLGTMTFGAESDEETSRAILDAYVDAAELDEPKAALFQTMDPAGRRLTGRALDRRLVLAMIKRRAAAAGLPPSTSP